MSSDFDYLAFLQKRCQHDNELAKQQQESNTREKSLDFEEDIKLCNNPDLVEQIRTKLLDSIEDMFYISEADYPFTFFFIPASKLSEKNLSTTKLPSVDEFRHLIKLDTPVAETQTSFEEFFDALKEAKSQSLKTTLEQFFEPSQLTIYRLGQIEISVWITGLIENVGLVGVSTLSVES